MSPEIVRAILMLVGPVAVVWLTWVSVGHWKMKAELDALKLYVAENYVKTDAIEKVFAKLDELSGMVHSIAGKLSQKD